MEDELCEPSESNWQEYSVASVPIAHMHFGSAFLFGAWYSLILASAMSAGVRYLHPETPNTHGILQSIAWATGSGFAIALASRLARTRRLSVGIGCALLSASIWAAYLFFLRDVSNEPISESLFGHAISVQSYLVGLSLLVLTTGVAGAFLGAGSRNDEGLTDLLLLVPSRHWLWLWTAAFAWVSVLPMIAYYLWLQFATAIYSTIHPSLWFQVGTGFVLGVLGIAALFKGVEISLRAVANKNSYGGVVWKRVLIFLCGTVILASVIAPLLLNIDISRMIGMPASMGSHPWWVL